MQTEFISITEITEKLIVKYDLPYANDNDKSSYRQKVVRALKETGIWDRGVDNKVGDKTVKMFTTAHMLELETSRQMYEYLRSRSQNAYKDRVSYDELNKSISNRRRKAINEYFSPNNIPIDPCVPVLNEEEYNQFVDRMMLRAIFEVFYTPIDEELLKKDIYTYKFLTEETELEIEDIEIEHRLNHPEGSYYSRKRETTKK